MVLARKFFRFLRSSASQAKAGPNPGIDNADLRGELQVVARDIGLHGPTMRVRHLKRVVSDDYLLGNLDRPSLPYETILPYIHFSGWALRPGGERTNLFLCIDGHIVDRCDRTSREDVARDRELDPTTGVGFSGGIWIGADPRARFQISIVDLTDGGELVPLWEIAIEQKVSRAESVYAIRSNSAPSSSRRLHVVTKGRSGSTLLMALLAAHPRILVRERPPYESHWLKMIWDCRAMALANLDRDMIGMQIARQHTVLGQIFNNNALFDDTNAVKSAHRVWQARRVLNEYDRELKATTKLVSELEGKEAPTFCAEKFFAPPRFGWDWFDPDRRIVVLSRNILDMLISMHDFNTKRGFVSFGLEGATTREWFIKTRYDLTCTPETPPILG